jgi:hypothetical protein
VGGKSRLPTESALVLAAATDELASTTATISTTHSQTRLVFVKESLLLAIIYAHLLPVVESRLAVDSYKEVSTRTMCYEGRHRPGYILTLLPIKIDQCGELGIFTEVTSRPSRLQARLLTAATQFGISPARGRSYPAPCIAPVLQSHKRPMVPSHLTPL